MALVSIMVGDAVNAATPTGAPLHDRVAVAVKLAFVTGVFQLALGLLKMGEIATYVSHPVMQGFSSGGEILIAISQLKMLFGIKIPRQKYAWQTLYYLFAHIKETQPYTLLMGVVTCALLYALSKWRRAIKARMEVGGWAASARAELGFGFTFFDLYVQGLRRATHNSLTDPPNTTPPNNRRTARDP